MRNNFQIIGIVLVIVGLFDIFILPRILESKISHASIDQDKTKAIGIAKKVAIISGLATVILGAVFLAGILPVE
jgi:hypothetical protein